jgi:Fic family protein
MIRKPPKWKDTFSAEVFSKITKHPEIDSLEKILSKANEDYLYWDKFKYLNFPEGLQPEEVWGYFKFRYRIGGENTQITSENDEVFSYNMSKTLYRELSYIDRHSAGFISSLSSKPSGVETDKLIISGLTEEAIASSQIEGASTTRKVAKEMLISGRKARNKDEQMIINTYKVMSQLDELKDVDLSLEMLLGVQTTITEDTLEYEDYAGRLRTDEDEIVVSDAVTGEIAHVPPKEKRMRKELFRLIAFANKKDSENDFEHPVLKAIVLHFWIAYLHPFPDGNGRTARAIFYWYLRKNNYWMFKYLSVSKAIKESRKGYDNAYLHSEHDDNDLTYFILYNIKAITKSIKSLLAYYDKKLIEIESNRKIASKFDNLNERQIALLGYFLKYPEKDTDIQTHKNKQGIAYETARQDLLSLSKKGILAETKKSNKKVFIPNLQEIKKIIGK